jgi:hypothetical protein
MKRSSICAAAAVGLLALTGSGATGSSSTSVDFGAISHQEEAYSTVKSPSIVDSCGRQ